jgi:hypothetical protein
VNLADMMIRPKARSLAMLLPESDEA